MLIQSRPDWSRVLWQIRTTLAFDVAFALGISVANELRWLRITAVPSTSVSLMGAALGIILGFRTNSAYQRWWEARMLWGQLVNSSRTLARQILTFTQDRRLAERIIRCQVAFVHALRRYLRGDDPARELRERLPEEDVPALHQEGSILVALLHSMQQRIAAAADAGRLTELRLQSLNQTLTDITSILGGCERIKNTPLPRQYDYYPELFIYLYCLMFPLSIVREAGMLTPILSAVVTFVFLTLNRIGKNLEDPFDSVIYGTPMLAISRTIEINLLQELGQEDLPDVVQAEAGVLA